MAQQCGQLKWELIWVAAASCVAFPNSRAGNAEFVVYHKVSPVGRILRKRLVQPPTKAGSALGSDQVAQDIMQLSLGKKTPRMGTVQSLWAMHDCPHHEKVIIRISFRNV